MSKHKLSKIMLEGLAGLLILFTLAQAASALADSHIYISQVLYDPAGTQSGGEFVLLENKGNATVKIGGWILATGASAKDVIFPPAASIEPGKTYLVADKGWNESRDNHTWPLADYEDVMTLANVNSGVALMDNTTVIDAVGWGNTTDGALFRGKPASPSAKGQSLIRISYTGSNDADFTAGTPSFNTGQDPGGIEIILNVIEPESPPSLMIQTEDDSAASGTQLIPFPGMNRAVLVNVTSSGLFADEVSIEFAGTNATLKRAVGSNQTFTGIINISYGMPPGSYAINAIAKKSGLIIASSSAQISISPVVSVSIDSRSLPVGDVAAGANIVISGDENITTPDSPTIWNSGNVPAGITVTGSDLIGASGLEIPASNIQVTLKRSRQAIDTTGLLETSQELGVVLDVGSLAGLDLSIQVPKSISGKYSGRVWLVATGGAR